jgi:hypothetical protein
MGQEFNTFNNSLSLLAADYIVGYGLVGGVEIEKRWTATDIATFMENNINLTKLDGSSDNYVEAVGTAAGGGQVTLQPGGADANQDLVLTGLGTGTVVITGTLTISADLDLNNNDLLTTGGDVLTAGGAINTGGGELTLGAGNIAMASGTLTLTSGDIVISNGDLTMGAAGTLDINGGTFKTDTIELSLGANIAIANDIVIGTGGESATVSAIIGNMTAPAAGNEPIDLELTGVVDLNGETFYRDKAYFDSDLMTKSYLRGSMVSGLTADVGSSQGDGLISKEFNQYSTVGNVGDAATLPVLNEEGYSLFPRYPYIHIIVRNDGANAMDVFPSSGGTINGGAADAAVSVASGTVEHFYGYENGGADEWYTA